MDLHTFTHADWRANCTADPDLAEYAAGLDPDDLPALIGDCLTTLEIATESAWTLAADFDCARAKLDALAALH